MKKFLCLSILLCFVFSGLRAQDTYYVLHIKGGVRLAETDIKLKTGDKISSEDRVAFDNKQSVAVVMSTGKGRFVLRGEEIKAGDELSTMVKTVLFPPKQNIPLSVRALREKAPDFDLFFGKENFLFLGEEFQLPLDTAKYPLRPSEIISLQFFRNGEMLTAFPRRLPDRLIFNRRELFGSGGEEVWPTPGKPVRLEQMNLQTGEQKTLATFQPVFCDEYRLARELNLMGEMLLNAGTDRTEIRDQIRLYTAESYGRFDPEAFEKWWAERKEYSPLKD